MKPSKEVVEAAALTLYNRIRGRWGMRPVGSLEGNQSALVTNLKGDVREALAAVLPLIVEECAKAAERKAQGFVNGPAKTAYGQGYQSACADIAAAIRDVAREA